METTIVYWGLYWDNGKCELSCLSCLVHSHMLVSAVTFSPQAPHSADHPGTAEVAPH